MSASRSFEEDGLRDDPRMTGGGRKIVAAEGPRALLIGFGPTAVGYFIQGGGKFAGYEFWKKQFVSIAGDQETAVKYRIAIYLGASSAGEYVTSKWHDVDVTEILLQVLCGYSPHPIRSNSHTTRVRARFRNRSRDGLREARS